MQNYTFIFLAEDSNLAITDYLLAKLLQTAHFNVSFTTEKDAQESNSDVVMYSAHAEVRKLSSKNRATIVSYIPSPQSDER